VLPVARAFYSFGCSHASAPGLRYGPPLLAFAAPPFFFPGDFQTGSLFWGVADGPPDPPVPGSRRVFQTAFPARQWQEWFILQLPGFFAHGGLPDHLFFSSSPRLRAFTVPSSLKRVPFLFFLFLPYLPCLRGLLHARPFPALSPV